MKLLNQRELIILYPCVIILQTTYVSPNMNLASNYPQGLLCPKQIRLTNAKHNDGYSIIKLFYDNYAIRTDQCMIRVHRMVSRSLIEKKSNIFQTSVINTIFPLQLSIISYLSKVKVIASFYFLKINRYFFITDSKESISRPDSRNIIQKTTTTKVYGKCQKLTMYFILKVYITNKCDSQINFFLSRQNMEPSIQSVLLLLLKKYEFISNI